MDTKELILELAEYIQGNRGDPDGYLASFFKRDGGNGYCCLDALHTHEHMKLWALRESRINYDNPRKKRMYNFSGDV